MREAALLFFLSFIWVLPTRAQSDTSKRELSAAERKQAIDKLNIDSAAILSEMATLACNCIDSIHQLSLTKEKELRGISNCIDEEVTGYQMAMKFLTVLKASGKKQQIEISTNKKSDEYKHYYYELERWLKDSCAVMNKALNSNDDAGEKSFSENAEAKAAYSKGVDFLQKEDYEKAIPWFEKAVAIDSVFAFAWDNLGVSYRKTGAYQKAEAAYKASLRIDPKGHTPLQNLPVVYIYEKKFDDAISAYQEILKYYPDDPEVYYGIGNVYAVHLKELEKGLDNLCKAYNLYVKQKSPYRSDAEKMINMIYAEMKKQNKEEAFFKILKENNVSAN